LIGAKPASTQPNPTGIEPIRAVFFGPTIDISLPPKGIESPNNAKKIVTGKLESTLDQFKNFPKGTLKTFQLYIVPKATFIMNPIRGRSIYSRPAHQGNAVVSFKDFP
jgi:hypothetical protein